MNHISPWTYAPYSSVLQQLYVFSEKNIKCIKLDKSESFLENLFFVCSCQQSYQNQILLSTISVIPDN